MTGRPEPPGSGVHTFTVRMSSPPDGSQAGWPGTATGCGGRGPNRTASNVPSHRSAGSGAANLRGPNGLFAYGIPLKTATPSCTDPLTSPVLIVGMSFSLTLPRAPPRVRPRVRAAALQPPRLLQHHRGQAALLRAPGVPVAERVPHLVIDQVLPVGGQIAAEMRHALRPAQRVDDRAGAVPAGQIAVRAQRPALPVGQPRAGQRH